MKGRKEKALDEPRVISYLRVSTEGQDLEKDKFEILKYVNQKELGNVKFFSEVISGRVNWKERLIAKIIEKLKEGDHLIVSEISRLGRSTIEVMEMLIALKKKGVIVHSLRNNLVLNGNFASEVVAFVFGLAADIERELISARTREGIAEARLKGHKPGRPKGSKSPSKLDPYKEEIEAFLKTGTKMTWIANRYNCTILTLSNWLKSRSIDKIKLLDNSVIANKKEKRLVQEVVL